MNKNKINLYTIFGCKDCQRITKYMYEALAVYDYEFTITDVDTDPVITAQAFSQIRKLGCTPKMFPFFVMYTSENDFIECFDAASFEKEDIYYILKKYEFRQF